MEKLENACIPSGHVTGCSHCESKKNEAALPQGPGIPLLGTHPTEWRATTSKPIFIAFETIA